MPFGHLHIEDTINLEEAARAVGTNPSALQRRIHRSADAPEPISKNPLRWKTQAFYDWARDEYYNVYVPFLFDLRGSTEPCTWIEVERTRGGSVDLIARLADGRRIRLRYPARSGSISHSSHRGDPTRPKDEQREEWTSEPTYEEDIVVLVENLSRLIVEEPGYDSDCPSRYDISWEAFRNVLGRPIPMIPDGINAYPALSHWVNEEAPITLPAVDDDEGWYELLRDLARAIDPLLVERATSALEWRRYYASYCAQDQVKTRPTLVPASALVQWAATPTIVPKPSDGSERHGWLCLGFDDLLTMTSEYQESLDLAAFCLDEVYTQRPHKSLTLEHHWEARDAFLAALVPSPRSLAHAAIELSIWNNAPAGTREASRSFVGAQRDDHKYMVDQDRTMAVVITEDRAYYTPTYKLPRNLDLAAVDLSGPTMFMRDCTGYWRPFTEIVNWDRPGRWEEPASRLARYLRWLLSSPRTGEGFPSLVEQFGDEGDNNLDEITSRLTEPGLKRVVTRAELEEILG